MPATHDTIEVLRNWRVHTIPRTYAALADWCRANRSPNEKPKGEGNASNLAFLASCGPDAPPVGHPRDHDISAVNGCAFDLDKGSMSDISALLGRMATERIGGVIWESHSSTAEAPAFRLLVLYAGVCPPEKHRVVYHAFATEYLAPFGTSTQFNQNRGHNPPREGADVLVIPGAPLPWQSLYLSAGPESKAKEHRTNVERETVEGEALDAIGESVGTALSTIWPAKGGGGHHSDLAMGRLLGERTSLSLEAIFDFAARFTEDPDSVRTSADRYRSGEEQLYGWPTLNETLGETGVAFLDALFGSWPAWTNAPLDEPDIWDVGKEPPKEATTPEGKKIKVPGNWSLTPLVKVFGEWPPIKYLQSHLDLAPGPPAILAGFGFSGKTMLAQSLALSVLTGGMVWGNPDWSATAGSVVHLDFEQGAQLTSIRYQRLCKGLGHEHNPNWDLQVIDAKGGYLDDPECLGMLAPLIKGKSLLIIDSLRAACPSLDENDSKSRIILDKLGAISHDTGCAMLVIHHAPKPRDDAKLGRATVRGTGAFFDAAGSVLVVGGERGAPRTCYHEKARSHGQPVEDFQLRIEGDAATGVTIEYQRPAASSDAFEHRATIALDLASNPISKAELKRKLREHMPAGDVDKLLRELVETHRLVAERESYYTPATATGERTPDLATLKALQETFGTN